MNLLVLNSYDYFQDKERFAKHVKIPILKAKMSEINTEVERILEVRFLQAKELLSKLFNVVKNTEIVK